MKNPRRDKNTYIIETIRYMRQQIIKYCIVICFMLINTLAWAQSEWENVGSSYFKWGSNYNVKISSNSLSTFLFGTGMQRRRKIRGIIDGLTKMSQWILIGEKHEHGK